MHLQQQENRLTVDTVPYPKNGFIWSSDSIIKSIPECSNCDLKLLTYTESILWKKIPVSDELNLPLIIKKRVSIIQPEGFQRTIEEKPYLPDQNAHLSLFFIVGIFAAGSISYLNRKSFTMLIKSSMTSLSTNEILRDRKHITGISFTAPFILSTILYSMFFAHLLRTENTFTLPYSAEIFLIGFLLIVLHICKNILIKILGDVFDKTFDAEEHILFYHQFYCFSSWIFPAVLALSLFSPVNNVDFFHILTALMISLSITYTTLKLFVNFSYNGLSSIALFIIYICSVEVIPVLLLIKMFYLENRF